MSTAEARATMSRDPSGERILGHGVAGLKRFRPARDDDTATSRFGPLGVRRNRAHGGRHGEIRVLALLNMAPLERAKPVGDAAVLVIDEQIRPRQRQLHEQRPVDFPAGPDGVLRRAESIDGTEARAQPGVRGGHVFSCKSASSG
ncbi:MAG: hypothetical protein U5Q44_01750 [Dehalococcoidia bacterium]|nr:hypothetical protein [Dehalococcoidia bacterium]